MLVPNPIIDRERNDKCGSSDIPIYQYHYTSHQKDVGIPLLGVNGSPLKSTLSHAARRRPCFAICVSIYIIVRSEGRRIRMLRGYARWG